MPKKILRRHKTASLRHEKQYYSEGYTRIFGIDEAGRGPWAGPVFAGTVCLPVSNDRLPVLLKGVRDSKDMTRLQRETLIETIQKNALAWGVGSASAPEIDDLGINKATRLAMQRALDAALEMSGIDKPDALFLDSLLWPEMAHVPQVSIVEGDTRSLSIAAASVLAKTARDALMLEYDAQYPDYGFAEHKGYGTAKHQAALKQYGPSPIHRTYYEPIRQLLQDEDDE